MSSDLEVPACVKVCEVVVEDCVDPECTSDLYFTAEVDSDLGICIGIEEEELIIHLRQYSDKELIDMLGINVGAVK